MHFADNLAALPAIDHLAGLELIAPDGHSERIDNRPGSAGSVRVYAYLAGKYGGIDATAAAEGLRLYAEHGDDARAHPGKHINIDRLLSLTGDQVWRVKLLPVG
jgi:hypothetical protein